MNNRLMSKLLLVALGVMQFLIVPIFSSQSMGGKVAFFSLVVILLTLIMLWQQSEWLLPWALIPLVGLVLTSIVSLSVSTLPGIGVVDLGTLAAGGLLCLLVANLAQEENVLLEWMFRWLQILGVIMAALCLYQYLDWVLAGTKTTTLIPYLLPPGNQRVNGVYGQPNLTALFLVLSMISFLRAYSTHKNPLNGWRGPFLGVGFLFVVSAFFLTGSRSGLVAFFVVIFILVCWQIRGRLQFPRRSLITIFLLIVLGFLFSKLPLSPEITSVGFSRPELSTDARFIYWVSSVLIWLRSPFVGVGLDHFKLFLPSYAPQAHDILGFVNFDAMGYTNWAHNEYLQTLAEAGIAGFVFLLAFVIMLLRNSLSLKSSNGANDSLYFLFLLILSFLIQGMFSWTFRHPALLFVFFLIAGIVLSKSPGVCFKARFSGRVLVTLSLLATFPVIGYISCQQYRFVQLKLMAKEHGCASASILSAMNDPYLGFDMMREVLPICVSDAAFFKNRPLVEDFKPYFVKISDLQGTYSQWYNLGLVYRSLGDYPRAEAALKKAVERQPVFELGWSVLHALHAEEASRKTGRPLADFLPSEKTHSVDFYDSFFKRH